MHCARINPVDEDAKQLPFGEAESGATGVELLLPLTLKWIEETRLPLVQDSRGLRRSRRASSVSAVRSSGRERRPVRIRSRALLENRARPLKSQGKNTLYGHRSQGQGGRHAGRRQVVYEAG